MTEDYELNFIIEWRQNYDNNPLYLNIWEKWNKKNDLQVGRPVMPARGGKGTKIQGKIVAVMWTSIKIFVTDLCTDAYYFEKAGECLKSLPLGIGTNCPPYSLHKKSLAFIPFPSLFCVTAVGFGELTLHNVVMYPLSDKEVDISDIISSL